MAWNQWIHIAERKFTVHQYRDGTKRCLVNCPSGHNIVFDVKDGKLVQWTSFVHDDFDELEEAKQLAKDKMGL